jgi:hypothetical protein
MYPNLVRSSLTNGCFVLTERRPVSPVHQTFVPTPDFRISWQVLPGNIPWITLFSLSSNLEEGVFLYADLALRVSSVQSADDAVPVRVVFYL